MNAKLTLQAKGLIIYQPFAVVPVLHWVLLNNNSCHPSLPPPPSPQHLVSLGWVKNSFLPPQRLACEQQTHFRSSLLSLRKIASANPSGKTISLTWNLLFWCWPIRSKDRIRLEWLLSTSRAEASWISARVYKYALEREFRDHNKVSCDVECWLLYEAIAS